jgi:hypothetical protein
MYVKQKRGETHPNKTKRLLSRVVQKARSSSNLTHAIHWFQVEAKIVPKNPNTSHTKLQVEAKIVPENPNTSHTQSSNSYNVPRISFSSEKEKGVLRIGTYTVHTSPVQPLTWNLMLNTPPSNLTWSKKIPLW